MINLSVNINKIATLRNARGGNLPDVTNLPLIVKNMVQMALQFIQGQMKDTLHYKMFTVFQNRLQQNSTLKDILMSAI